MADRRGLESHDTHDLELVARAAAGDLGPGEAIVARDLLATCDICTAVAADLRRIAVATRELGSAASGVATGPAPRDFRLTEADAARLRRRGFLGLGGFRGGLAGRARGLGGALAALGLVGLLVSAGAPSLFTGAGGAATSESAAGLAKDSASMAAELAPAGAPAEAAGPNAASDAPPRVMDTARDDAEATVGRPAPLVIGSAAVLVAGLALLIASRRGRRAGP